MTAVGGRIFELVQVRVIHSIIELPLRQAIGLGSRRFSSEFMASLVADISATAAAKGAIAGQKTYQTYTKTNPITGEVYSGRTSGRGSPFENVARREVGHHMNEKGFDVAVAVAAHR